MKERDIGAQSLRLISPLAIIQAVFVLSLAFIHARQSNGLLTPDGSYCRRVGMHAHIAKS
jgi:hypothetical protein